DSDNFTSSNAKRYVFNRRAMLAGNQQALDLKNSAGRFGICFIHAEKHITPYYHAGQILGTRISGFHISDHLPVTHSSHVIRDRQALLELLRDNDDRLT